MLFARQFVLSCKLNRCSKLHAVARKNFVSVCQSRSCHAVVYPGNVSSCRYVPNNIVKPQYALDASSLADSYPSELIKHESDVETFRQAGLIAFAILKYAGT